MITYTMFTDPGISLSCTASAVETARRGTGLRWSAVDAPRGLNHALGGNVVTTVMRDAAGQPVGVRSAADLPVIKQVRVPLSPRERCP